MLIYAIDPETDFLISTKNLQYSCLFVAYIGVASWFQKRTIETKKSEDLLFFGNLF
jgi:hypothetical protein